MTNKSKKDKKLKKTLPKKLPKIKDKSNIKLYDSIVPDIADCYDDYNWADEQDKELRIYIVMLFISALTLVVLVQCT